MNKTIVKVFVIVGILVGVFLAWQLIFNDGGILKTGYNAFVTGVNGQWHKAAGSNSDILASWGSNNADANGKAFEIDTSN